MTLLPFKAPSRLTRLRLAMYDFWAWLRFKYHNCYWVDYQTGPLTNSHGTTVGHYTYQKCRVPGCGKKRQIKLT